MLVHNSYFMIHDSSWKQFNSKLANLGYTETDRFFIETAFSFASKAHEGQMRASGEPYITHCIAVAATCADMRLDAVTVSAALLHDVIEDCGIPREKIAEQFGNDTAFLVEGVSKLGSVRYNDAQQKVESLRKMFLAFAKDIRVVLIKLADRLHNMQTIQYVLPEKQKRIAQETLEIYAPIAYRLGMGTMKGELEDLAFPIIYPEEYAWITQEVHTSMPEGEQYLSEEVKPVLQQTLAAEGINSVTINYRKKHVYSLWKKVLKYDMDLRRVTDLLAMRIIVNDIEDCYRALGVVHQLWKPLPGQIKDYIALPKQNGYRSIHTTVFCVRSKITEFQIRTHAMHEEAERGVAAHWAYAESGKPKSGLSVSGGMKWVQRLSDWQKEMGSNEDSEEFLESLKIDFFKDRVFVLTPKGDVIDLPAHATPVDFAYAVHSDIGNHMMGAKVNGKLVSFDRPLVSGEKVEILTQKNKKPNAEWLTFVKSSFAKNRIRAAMRREFSQNPSPTAYVQHTERLPHQFILTVQDRVGLLKDISAVFSAHRISIQNVAVNSPKNKPYPEIVITAPMRDSKQADSIATRLKNIRDVEEVSCKVV
ncbi:MAG: GTP pyrophosphokinase [Parcubacteria group bacterium Gr01-1014_70]|nr:MAG: GTP pyrophosphokinase [Parcubacteria group bacterium Gr01-1014_70]